MKTKLIEFLNAEQQYLRGVLTLPATEIKMGAICLHGFERCSTTEKKFKAVADRLAGRGIATLRLDFSGCGLSDGDFQYTTIEKQGLEFVSAITALQEVVGNNKIVVIAHSLGACILASQIEKLNDVLGRIVLLAPALNQKDLMRYWFVASQMKKTSPGIEINWENYADYLNEKEFIEDCNKTNKTTKANYIKPEYFLTSKDLDYSDSFNNATQQIMHIHGSKDMAVPFESLMVKFENQIIVDSGDHDLERPNQLEQWLQPCVDFLSQP